MKRRSGEVPITKASDGPKTIDELLLAIRPGLEDSLSRIKPEQRDAFLEQFADATEHTREQVEFNFSPVFGVYEMVVAFAEGVWHNELKNILLFIYERGGIKGELNPADAVRLLDSIGDEEIIHSVKSTKTGRIKQFLPKIRSILSSGAVISCWARRQSKTAKR